MRVLRAGWVEHRMCKRECHLKSIAAINMFVGIPSYANMAKRHNTCYLVLSKLVRTTHG
jgi:hypothetical protein